MDIKESVEILNNATIRIQILSDFADKEYCSQALQTLIEYAFSSQAKIKELEIALDTAHKIFGSESDRLGAMIKELEDKLAEKEERIREWNNR